MEKNNLTKITGKLEELEDIMIISLLKRMKYKLNSAIYIPNKIPIKDFNDSFLDFMLRGTEELHSLAGRYLDQEEHSFNENLPDPIIYREVEDLGIQKITNINKELKKIYFNFIKRVCEKGEDRYKYGSTALADVDFLQNASRRIHIGEQVAEAKFQDDPIVYMKLIKERDTKGLLKKLTRKEIEERIYIRLKEKGETYKINPELILKFYKNKLIPLTKKVEINYFYNRK